MTICNTVLDIYFSGLGGYHNPGYQPSTGSGGSNVDLLPGTLAKDEEPKTTQAVPNSIIVRKVLLFDQDLVSNVYRTIFWLVLFCILYISLLHYNCLACLGGLHAVFRYSIVHQFRQHHTFFQISLMNLFLNKTTKLI